MSTPAQPKPRPVFTPQPKTGPVLGLVGPKQVSCPQQAASALVAPAFRAPLQLVSAPGTQPGYFPAGVASLLSSPPPVPGRQAIRGNTPGTRRAAAHAAPTPLWAAGKNGRAPRATTSALFSSRVWRNGQVPPYDMKAAMFDMDPTKCNLYQMAAFSEDEIPLAFQYCTGICPESQLLTRNRERLTWVIGSTLGHSPPFFIVDPSIWFPVPKVNSGNRTAWLNTLAANSAEKSTWIEASLR
jgi:hypothetical protein